MGGSHAPHGSQDAAVRTPRLLARLIGLAVALLVLATGVGLVLLRPDAALVATVPDGGAATKGTVTALRAAACDGSDLPSARDSVTDGFTGAPAQGQSCIAVSVRLDEGPDRGQSVDQLTNGDVLADARVGQGVVLLRPTTPQTGAGGLVLPLTETYQLVDVQRGRPLLALAVLFVLAVVVLARLRGLLALVGLALSLVVIVGFLVPALLAGRPALPTAVVGASAVMLAVLLLAHGPNVRTGVAILGTTASLLLILALSTLFVRLTSLTGATTDEALYVRSLFGTVDLRGLLLAGMVIGALGILDDVTVSQVSTVWELRAAGPALSRRELYAAGLRVGRDHIASTVNTLLLAYAGAALPLLVIVTTARQGGGNTLTSSTLAEEIVRTLTGSIGLVAAVPLTTALAVLVCPATVLAREPEPTSQGAG